MDLPWLERLQAWREETERKLRTEWYLWPIGFALELLWHRVYANTNDFLDSHGASVVSAVTRHIPPDPVPLALILAVLILLGLAIHAYVDTRKNGRNKPASPASQEEVLSRREAALKKSEEEITERIKLENYRASLRGFKLVARRIRRTWPETDFNKRPLNMQSWIPSLNSQAYAWLQLASEWRDGMCKIPYVADQPGALVNSMDFDEVMELLDDAELAKMGGTPRVALAPEHFPDVEIVSWGTLDNSEEQRYNFGLSVRNSGQAAHRISIFPAVKLGRLTLSSDTMPLLLDEHGVAFLKVFLRSPDGGLIVPNTIARTISEELPANRNGVRLPPILRLVYQTSNDSWLGSTYEIYVGTDNTSLIFRRLKHEILMSPGIQELRDADSSK